MTKEQYEYWVTPSISAYVWSCGDEYCDCHQPRVELHTPNFRNGFPWGHVEILWEGTFKSEPDTAEYVALVGELNDVVILAAALGKLEYDHAYARVALAEDAALASLEAAYVPEEGDVTNFAALRGIPSWF